MAQETRYIRFTRGIDEQSVTNLMNHLQAQIQSGINHIVILFSSTGGNVYWGMTAYTFLKGLPAQVDFHAFGRVNSVAIPIYCAGNRRYVAPNTSFMMHGIGFNVPQKMRFNLKSLTARMMGLESDTNTICRVISENCEKTIEEIKAEMFEGRIWTTEQALEFGLAHERKQELFPEGANVITI